ncbi:MAG: tyrosine-type recombinase/integrase, partial [Bdellovibrio sp.]
MSTQTTRQKKAYLPTNFQNLNEWQKKEVAIINMWLAPKSKTTRKNYLYLYESLKAYVPGLAIWELDTIHFSAFFTKISVDKSKRTMALYRSILMSLMEYVVKMGLAPFNPVLKTIEYKYTRNLRSRVLVEEDVLKLIEQSEGRNRAIIMLLYHTGMRVSELANLKWSHFFYEPEKIRIEILGKGDKVRHIFLRYAVFHEIRSLLIKEIHDESCNYL